MLNNKPEYYAGVDRKIKEFFYAQYFSPILEIIGKPAPKLNAGFSSLASAIRSSKVQYVNGVFTGTFSMAISNELARFAKFDVRSKTWKGNPPPEIKASAILANDKRKELTEKLNRVITEIESKVDENIRSLSFEMDLPIFTMTEDIKKDLYKIGVMPELDKRTMDKMRADYTESQKMNVKNWTPDQIQRMREMVERIQTTGDTSSLQDEIMREWDVTSNKAHFLARQETSLFFSKLSMNRASAAGVRRYKWSTSHDERVRHDHIALNGTIHAMDNPPIVDKKTGRRGHPGTDYNCRCAAIWVLE